MWYFIGKVLYKDIEWVHALFLHMILGINNGDLYIEREN